MTDENYPYDKIFDQPHPGLIRQELVTYTELDGQNSSHYSHQNILW